MATIDGHWHPGIGDPTPLGWFTVAAYAFAAWSCWRTASGVRDTPWGDFHPRAARFWLLLAVALGLMAVNKQLDAQTALTDIGRQLAVAQGWYAQRHKVQIVFVAAVALVAGAGLAALWWASRPLSTGRATAAVGLLLLIGFVMVRAASFHHVDAFLAESALGLRWNWILELGGIGVVAAGAWFESRASRRGAVPVAERG